MFAKPLAALSFAPCIVIGLALSSIVPSAGMADDKLILVQRVELTTVDGNATYVGIGTGPFTTAFPNGIDVSGAVTEQKPGKPAPTTDLTQGRIADSATTEAEFGSIGATQGSIIKNSAGKPVDTIQITTQGMTGGTANGIDTKSTDGSDFDTAIAGKTITFTAKTGKALPKNQFIWMLIPKGPQPGTAGDKIYKGKVTTVGALTPPAPERQTAQAPKAGNTSGAVATFSSATQTISFSAGEVSFAKYFDGTTVTANGPGEPVIGTQIQVGDMQILGPSPSVPGAFALSDSGVALVANGQTLLQGELVNDLLIPDASHPGFAEIQGSLSFWDEGAMVGSRYVGEFFSDSIASDLFIDTDLLAATGNLTTDGSGVGSAVVASVAVPEPSTDVLLSIGLLAFLGSVTRRATGVRLSRLPRAPSSQRRRWYVSAIPRHAESGTSGSGLRASRRMARFFS
jgi:hypothetical protein